MGNREYIIRKFTEKPRQEYRYRYVKLHPSICFRKETYTAEKTNIEPKTNYQKTLAEYARRLEKIHEELKQLTNALHDFKLVKKESKKEAEEKLKKLEMEHFWEYAKRKRKGN